MSLDAQSIAYDKPEDTPYTEFSQSIAHTRDVGGPKPANAELGVNIVPSREILDAVIRTHPKSRNCTIMKIARRKQHALNLEKYTKESRMLESAGRETSDIDLNCHKTSPMFHHILKYNPLQKEVITALWHSKSTSLVEAIQPMMILSRPEPFQAQYSGHIPAITKDGRCPYCEKQLRSTRAAIHILQCYCDKNQVRFCFDCATIISTGQHTCPRPDALSATYGVITWRGLLIREGRCPYPQCIYKARRWKDAQPLKIHVERHLSTEEETNLRCPVVGCNNPCSTIHDLRIHLQHLHRIGLVSTRDLLECCNDDLQASEEPEMQEGR
jgi:hypothetical protein